MCMWQRIKNIYHLFVAIVANLLFLFPSNDLTVIAVTGTDGKTTTVNLIYHILKSSGRKVSMVSSIGAVVNGKKYDTGFHVTTPSPFQLQRLFQKAKNEGSKYFVLESTSHALDQNRLFGIHIDIGVLTNVTSEHLDYHKTYDNYLKTKAKLLRCAKICVVNSDDDSYKHLSDVKEEKDAKSWVTYGLSDDSKVNPRNFDLSSITLIGSFNRYNVLAAVAATRMLGINDKEIKSALSSFKLPVGRVEYVYRKDFGVMIDFAHTPNSFEKILSFVRPLTKGRLIHVFGSAGERDKSKRPLMGEISAKYADILILTAEDPRSEDVNEIIAEIEKGIKNDEVKVVKVPQRREAIQRAIKMAQKDDLVLITGKAQEGSMNYGNKETPWDEFLVVRDALQKLKNEN